MQDEHIFPTLMQLSALHSNGISSRQYFSTSLPFLNAQNNFLIVNGEGIHHRQLLYMCKSNDISRNKQLNKSNLEKSDGQSKNEDCVVVAVGSV